MNVKLYNDDCLNVLKDVDDNSIDLILTDPPYEVITGGRNGGVYTEKYFSVEKRHYLKDNNTVYWIFLWCFLIGVTKLKVNKE